MKEFEMTDGVVCESKTGTIIEVEEDLYLELDTDGFGYWQVKNFEDIIEDDIIGEFKQFYSRCKGIKLDDRRTQVLWNLLQIWDTVGNNKRCIDSKLDAFGIPLSACRTIDNGTYIDIELIPDVYLECYSMNGGSAVVRFAGDATGVNRSIMFIQFMLDVENYSMRRTEAMYCWCAIQLYFHCIN